MISILAKGWKVPLFMKKCHVMCESISRMARKSGKAEEESYFDTRLPLIRLAFLSLASNMVDFDPPLIRLEVLPLWLLFCSYPLLSLILFCFSISSSLFLVSICFKSCFLRKVYWAFPVKFLAAFSIKLYPNVKIPK